MPFQAGVLMLLLFSLHDWLMKSVKKLQSSPDISTSSISSAGQELGSKQPSTRQLRACKYVAVAEFGGIWEEFGAWKSLGLISGGADA